MCAHCALTDSVDMHVDGTVLNRDLKPLFSGSSDGIMDFIMDYPLEVYYVWISGEGEPISIDEWTEWMDETDPES
jgi:hypothetical protein